VHRESNSITVQQDATVAPFWTVIEFDKWLFRFLVWKFHFQIST